MASAIRPCRAESSAMVSVTNRSRAASGPPLRGSRCRGWTKMRMAPPVPDCATQSRAVNFSTPAARGASARRPAAAGPTWRRRRRTPRRRSGCREIDRRERRPDGKIDRRADRHPVRQRQLAVGPDAPPPSATVRGRAALDPAGHDADAEQEVEVVVLMLVDAQRNRAADQERYVQEVIEDAHDVAPVEVGRRAVSQLVTRPHAEV